MNIKTKYVDKVGTIIATTQYEKDEFILDIDGTKFTTDNFNFFQWFSGNKQDRIKVDELNRLLNCSLIFNFPIAIFKNEVVCQSILEVEIQIGSEQEPNDCKILKQKLTLESYSIESNSCVNIELEKLIKILPIFLKIRSCFTCASSDYGVYGNSFFGSMVCFKNVKEEYSKIKGKEELFIELLKKGEGFFDETYSCDDYKIRQKNTGYRG
jgi:hypothetical protein